MCCLFRLSVPTAAAAGICAVDKEMVGLAGRTSERDIPKVSDINQVSPQPGDGDLSTSAIPS